MLKKSSSRRSLIRLTVLFLFLAVTLSIQFVHTETVITAFHSKEDTHTHAPQNKQDTDRDCPACHFMNSSFSTSVIAPLILPPPPVNVGWISMETVHPHQIFSVLPTSRSPPAA